MEFGFEVNDVAETMDARFGLVEGPCYAAVVGVPHEDAVQVFACGLPAFDVEEDFEIGRASCRERVF